MKTHLNLATSDLDAKPVKVRTDYALFITQQPGLELALDLDASTSPLHVAHFGINVDSVIDVEEAIKRLEAAQLVSSIERDETCCYANQTKVWSIDPDGRRWEVYTVNDETDLRDDADAACCTTQGEERSCRAA